jgi:hypothetical protein
VRTYSFRSARVLVVVFIAPLVSVTTNGLKAIDAGISTTRSLSQ